MRTEWCYRKAVDLRADYDLERRRFASVLAGVVKENRGPIYFDESS